MTVYIACAGTREIIGFDLDAETGTLSRTGSVMFPGDAPVLTETPGNVLIPAFSAPLALSPDGTCLYAILRSPSFAVASYAIQSETGALRLIGEAPLPNSTPFATTDRSGRWLIGAAYHGDCLWVSRIGDDGAVMGEAVHTIEGVSMPHCVMVSADNNYVWAAAAGDDEIRQFRFDAASGSLSPCDPPAVAIFGDSRPRHFALHPNGRWLYCIAETGGTIWTYAIDPESGCLTLLSSAAMPRPGEHAIAADLHISPGGRFLYGSERAQGSISAFAIDPASGALDFIEAVATERIPRSFAIHSSGRWLVSAGQETARIAVHALDPRSGHLGEGIAYDAGIGPSWVTIAAD